MSYLPILVGAEMLIDDETPSEHVLRGQDGSDSRTPQSNTAGSGDVGDCQPETEIYSATKIEFWQ